MADAQVASLRQAVVQTQSPNPELRKPAEAYLKSVELQPLYSQHLIKLIETHCAGNTAEDKIIRQATAVLFKNLIKTKWSPEEGDGKENAVSDQDKDFIKAHIVQLMCMVPPEVQRQFSEALAVIGEHDFPAKWPTLIPELAQKFQSKDYHIICGTLQTANSIVRRYRYKFRSDELFAELKEVLGHMAPPLLKLLKDTWPVVEAFATNREGLLPVFEALYLMQRVFFSLSYQDLPEFFEDNMAEWMSETHKYLVYTNPLLQEGLPQDGEAGPVEKLQAAVVENVNHYAEMYDEEFSKHLPTFATAVWSLLMKVGPGKKDDFLATTCIKFLTKVISKQIHFDLFKEEGTLKQIAENIVVPNITLRESDEELFEFNPTDYIRLDMEGSDSDTRRRAACDLVRGMCKHFEEPTTRICSEFVTELLQQYTSAPDANWRAKDSAIQLLLALAVRAQSHAGGVRETNQFVNVMEVFASTILPEIQGADVSSRPIVRADCLKFVATFRNQFTVEQLAALMPLLMAHLRSDHVVVQTYAAMAVERILTVKERPPGQRPTPRFGKERLAPFLEQLFTNLFGVLDNPDLPENDYIMKAIMRALNTAKESVLPVTQIVLSKMVVYLEKACANPANPHFNHYLFESMAVLVRQSCEADPAVADVLERSLFPPFEKILQLDVVEFQPYAFQILAQLLELRPGKSLSKAYEILFPVVVTPAAWQSKGNVPALTRLVEAYLGKDPVALIAAGQLIPILGLFQKLLSSRLNEAHAFHILGKLVATLTPAELEQHLVGGSNPLKEAVGLQLRRLQTHKTVKYVRYLTVFWCTLIAKHSVTAFEHSIALQGQEGLMEMILSHVWIPNFSNALVLDAAEQKFLVVGMTKMLHQSAKVQSDAKLWGGLLSAVMSILAPEDPGRGGGGNADAEQAEEEEDVQYDSTFSLLHFAASPKRDVLPEVPSPRVHLAQALAAVSAAKPGVYPPVVGASLSPHAQAKLQEFLLEAKVAMV